MNEIQDLEDAIATENIDIVNAVIAAGVPITQNTLIMAIRTSDAHIVNAVIAAGTPVRQAHIYYAQQFVLGVEAGIVNVLKKKLQEQSAIDSQSETLAEIAKTENSPFSAEILAHIGLFATDGNCSIVSDAEAQAIVNKHFHASDSDGVLWYNASDDSDGVLGHNLF